MTISIEEFAKLDMRIGTVLSVEKVEGTDKLLKFELDFGDEKRTISNPGDEKSDVRTIIGGWALSYPDPTVLVGTQLGAILNLEPRTIRGIESQGMLLSAVQDGLPIALHPDKPVANGSQVR